MTEEIFLYHQVPEHLRGDAILPGNDLPQDLREKALAKYAGREGLRAKRLPLLDCLWNDAVQMLAVHPAEVKRAAGEHGFRRYAREPQRWFAIPLGALDHSRLMVYRFDEAISAIDIPETREEAMRIMAAHEIFERFDPAKIGIYRTVPEATRRYYAKERAKGPEAVLFPYQFIPHIFYRGEIPIAGLRNEIVQLA
jgi:hypothetical protein